MAKAPRSLAGIAVAITGGGRGIGRATAAALISQGARVAIGDIDGALAEQTAAELAAGTIGLPLDVTDRTSFAAFLDAVEQRLGPLDVLINNAGIMPLGRFVTEPDAVTRRMVDVNVHGVINGSKLALERFLPRRRGHLVQIASFAGKIGLRGGVTYCATKHAVVGLSEALRSELRGSGVEISVVMPVVVHTELGSGLPETRAFKAVEPEDVAAAIVEALRSGRFEVYVPRAMSRVVRIAALLPRPVSEAIGRLLRGDRVLAAPDTAARAAYDARLASTIDAAPTPHARRPGEPGRAPAAARPAEAEPQPEAEPQAQARPQAEEPRSEEPRSEAERRAEPQAV